VSEVKSKEGTVKAEVCVKIKILAEIHQLTGLEGSK
jgi:hypothetical protein